MIADLLKDKQFLELEKEFKFLARARGESTDQLECVIFDTETTGLDPTKHELTEIAGMKIRGSEMVDVFSSLIKPENPVPDQITKITGISQEMVNDFPDVSKILPQFMKFAGDLPLVAHNAEFDTAFVSNNLKKIGQPELKNDVACTLKLARYLLPNLSNHKLHTVAHYFKIETPVRHRAMGDVEITFQVWTKFLELLKNRNINSFNHLKSLLAEIK